jgi:AraC-like DNA-binding protein
VSEVAYRSGFLDPSGFSRMFRHRFGITPSEALSDFNLQGQDPAPDSPDAGLSK